MSSIRARRKGAQFPAQNDGRNRPRTFSFLFFGYSCILELSLAVGIRADRNIPRYKYMLSQAGTVGKRQPKALFFFFFALEPANAN